MKNRLGPLWAASALVVGWHAGAAAAVDYPSRPVKIVVNSAPGALLDATTRTVAQRMSEILGQPIIVENNAGASGMLGIRVVKSAPADGYTLLATANTIAQVPALKLHPGYDLVKDFTGIGMMNRAPLIMVGWPGQPARNLQEFVGEARSDGRSMAYATAGVGTSTHMAAALFLQRAGLKMLHVPFKGNAAAMPDVMAGRVNVIFDGANSSGPLVREGKLRAFGVTSPTRMPTYPEIPTLAEQGLPGYSFHVYMGLVAPAGTPGEVIRKLSGALKASLSSGQVRERFQRDGAEAGSMSPDEFTAFLKQDMLRTVQVATDLGIPKE